ncbi:MAG: Wadjet anti-phage system protein JetA family protein [Anaerovoracaceae bacterium]
MNLFDYLKNDSFFRPFNLKYKRIYYDCIQLLIDKTKELPVLYESDARDCITFYLRNSEVQTGEPDAVLDKEVNTDGESDEPGTDLQASNIITLFRNSGWILPKEIGRNGEYVVNISTGCRRIMDFLRKITERSGQGTMSNRIFSMYEIMKSAFDKDSVRMDRPYTNILVPLLDNETELKNELTDLKDSIAGIMKAVIAFQDINCFGQFILKDEMLDRFFSEYFFIKNNGLIPTQLSFIRSRLRRLKDKEILQRMVIECAEKLQLDMNQAEERVNRYFAELQHFLNIEYEENMELIDARINNYYNLANTRIMLMVSSGVRLESIINDFLNNAAKLSQEEQDRAMEKIGECSRIMQQKYVGYKSFEKKQPPVNRCGDISLFTEELSDEEKAMQTEELFRSSVNRYSVERTGEYFDAILGSGNSAAIGDSPLETREEALMYAAAMIYSDNIEFPFEIKIEDRIVKTEIADITGAVIFRKCNKNQENKPWEV